MSKFWRVFLWVLAIIGVVGIVGVGVGGYWFYRQIDKYAINYSCRDFTQLLNAMIASDGQIRQGEVPKAEEFDFQMKANSTAVMFSLYSVIRAGLTAEEIRSNTRAFKLKMSDNAVTYANEIAAICRAYPQLTFLELLGGQETSNQKSRAAIQKYLSTVQVVRDARAETLGKVIALQVLKDEYFKKKMNQLGPAHAH
ncbi:MAG: hypothetical protein EBQ80_03250 [Proteobacteria bacterium]|nr:hypothetical protein [Pseudomonadota bacterium]